MRLALFDLDNTLLAGDSDVAWGHFLASVGAVDGKEYVRMHDYFYEQYMEGTLDIREFCRFSFQPLLEHPLPHLQQWRQRFVEEHITNMVAPGSASVLEQHRAAGDTLVIITATNSFVTRPIADLLGVEHLIATEPEISDGRFTGELQGIPCFQDGKIQRLQHWLEARGEPLTRIAEATFYSDSRNDIPLLEAVRTPVAVDPDPLLAAHAEQKGWPRMSLRDAPLESMAATISRSAEPYGTD